MTRCLLILLLLLSSLVLQGQVCDVPSFYSFKTGTDYQKHEPRVLQCMKMLSEKPLHSDAAHRSKALLYVMLWLQGAPNLRVETYSEFLFFEEESPEYVAEFIYLLALSQMSFPERSAFEHHLAATADLLRLAEMSEGPEGPFPNWLLHLRSVNLELFVSELYRAATEGR